MPTIKAGDIQQCYGITGECTPLVFIHGGFVDLLDDILAGTSCHQPDGLGEILSCKIVCASEHEGVWPSDHFGVYAELQAEVNHT